VRLEKLVSQLREEVRSNEIEISRLKLMHASEIEAMHALMNEQAAEIDALSQNYNQLMEFSKTTNPTNDMQDLLDLVQEIYTRWPETRSLMQRVGKTGVAGSREPHVVETVSHATLIPMEAKHYSILEEPGEKVDVHGGPPLLGSRSLPVTSAPMVRGPIKSPFGTAPRTNPFG
jgi:hypothetical protein